MKVFISGPMTGIDNFNRDAFNNAEKEFIKRGLDVFNPAWMLFSDGWAHEEIMSIDINALSLCKFICMLPGWEDSKGARLENEYAITHGIIPIYIEEDF